VLRDVEALLIGLIVFGVGSERPEGGGGEVGEFVVVGGGSSDSRHIGAGAVDKSAAGSVQCVINLHFR
jgi:hypothetical protein